MEDSYQLPLRVALMCSSELKVRGCCGPAQQEPMVAGFIDLRMHLGNLLPPPLPPPKHLFYNCFHNSAQRWRLALMSLKEKNPDMTERTQHWGQGSNSSFVPYGWWEAQGFPQYQRKCWEDERSGAFCAPVGHPRGSWESLSGWEGSITNIFIHLKNDPICHLRLTLAESFCSSTFVSGLQPSRMHFVSVDFPNILNKNAAINCLKVILFPRQSFSFPIITDKWRNILVIMPAKSNCFQRWIL